MSAKSLTGALCCPSSTLATSGRTCWALICRRARDRPCSWPCRPFIPNFSMNTTKLLRPIPNLRSTSRTFARPKLGNGPSSDAVMKSSYVSVRFVVQFFQNQIFNYFLKMEIILCDESTRLFWSR